MTAESVDALIIGGGAAGLMCAIAAGRRGRRVVVLERNQQVGRKILISGGGRCNFTNLNARPEHFLSANPHFAKSALARYTPADFLAMVERHGIRYHEKTAGQLFCDESAKAIVDMLLAECAAAGVRIETGSTLHSVNGAFEIEASSGSFRSQALVIATGGLSIPKIGATPFGYELARRYGLRVTDCRPALVPWTFAKEERDRFTELAGVATEAAVCTEAARFRDRVLFTHRGLSGPAVLQASSYWRMGQSVIIDWAPGTNIGEMLREARAARVKSEPQSVAARVLPRRMAERWFGAGGGPVASISDRTIEAMAESVHRWRFRPAGTEGFEKAEVTAGGVDTADLSSQTMEARNVPGLYFIGEVVDVTGQLGGFNFQWAWASGWAAGSAL